MTQYGPPDPRRPSYDVPPSYDIPPMYGDEPPQYDGPQSYEVPQPYEVPGPHDELPTYTDVATESNPERNGFGFWAVTGIVTLAVLALAAAAALGVGGTLLYQRANPPTTTASGGSAYGVPVTNPREGDCLQQVESSDAKKRLVTAQCKPGTYRVVKRYNDTGNVDICGATYEFGTSFKDPETGKEFVVCASQVR